MLQHLQLIEKSFYLKKRNIRTPHHRQIDGIQARHHQNPRQQRINFQSGMDEPSTSTNRKSTRLNSSHVKISYAVFCLKKKIKKSGKLQEKQIFRIIHHS